MASLPGDSDSRGSAPRSEAGETRSDAVRTRSEAGGTRRIMCARCGIPADGPPPTWTCSVENGDRHYFCDTCSRDNLRAIEGRLDSPWW
ncbi:hypothetical protein AB0912_05305 [Streptomyces sp. NPDC007084]|uniref:hypothetical protein n=1 Tax=Streptomyces sp. NPDC007084 TaxID=3154313 RepID=UPI003452D92B